MVTIRSPTIIRSTSSQLWYNLTNASFHPQQRNFPSHQRGRKEQIVDAARI